MKMDDLHSCSVVFTDTIDTISYFEPITRIRSVFTTVSLSPISDSSDF